MKDFLTSGTLAVGANYWASHAGPFMWRNWEHAVVKSDFELLSQHGITLLRVFPLWPDFQPIELLCSGEGHEQEFRHGEKSMLHSQGQIRDGVSLEMLDRLVALADLAQEQEISLIIGLITGWMSGRLFVPPALGRFNPITDPRSIIWQVRLAQTIVRRLKDHSAIQAWDLGNECNVMGGCTREQAWLWTSTLANAIRCIDGARPVISGMHGLSADPRKPWAIRDQGELTDILTTHPYPLFTPHCHQEPINTQRPLLHATAESCLYRDLSGKPAIIEEFGTLGPMVASDEIAGDVMRNTMMNAWAHDLRATLWWCAFDQLNIKQAPHDWLPIERELGLFRENKEPKPALTAARDVRTILEALPIRHLPPRRIDAVCILTPGQNQWGVAYSAFILAKQAGFDLQFHYADHKLLDSAFYLLPSLKELNTLTGEQEEELWKRVAEGASLYISLDNAFLSQFSRKIGLEVITRHNHARTCSFTFAGHTFQWPVSVESKFKAVGAKIIASETNGNPIFTLMNYGRGKVYFLSVPIESILANQEQAFLPGSEQPAWKIYQHMAGDILRLRKIQKHSPILGVTEHPTSESSCVVVIINYSAAAATDTITLAPGWNISESWLGGKPVVHWDGSGINVELPPHGWSIWSLTSEASSPRTVPIGPVVSTAACP